MLHSLIYGIFLGWGAAIPLGPMNIEIIRRNLMLGARYGLVFSFGACSADLFYVLLLSFGALKLLLYPMVLRIVGMSGSLVLAWFGISALKLSLETKLIEDKAKSSFKLYVHYFHGLTMTAINPYTIIFWASVSSQVVSITAYSGGSYLVAAFGVVLGALSWAIGLNSVLFFTRHKVSNRVMSILNIVGGVILLCFSLIGVIHFAI